MRKRVRNRMAQTWVDGKKAQVIILYIYFTCFYCDVYTFKQSNKLDLFSFECTK